MAKLIRVNGYTKVVHPKSGKHFTLEELKELIGGGYIEFVHFSGRGNGMIVDEDGLAKDLPYNQAATIIYQDIRRTNDTIVGDALLINEDEWD